MSERDAMGRLLDIMIRLRDRQAGCPWDMQQTFRTIAPYTIEEAHEVADAIERDDLEGLRDELGDLLFQVVFHARMAEEQGAFTFDDVARAIADKLERRHPHVFGETEYASAEVQTAAWEDIKAAERSERGENDDSALAGVSRGLPALRRAVKLQKRAARVGFDWPDIEPIFGKLAEESAELRQAIAAGDEDNVEEEIGDLLFVITNLARKLEVDPGGALRRSNYKFEQRFRRMEALAQERGLTLSELDAGDQEQLYQVARRQLNQA
ncbi:MAG: nucleoside triphosphate pyrophosphohydrolase [Pseudomonadota bacterium]|nr:MAG: nucleoside triphosphate pyrophosphohydrolase [Pseudomonadota bacterium]